MLKEFVDRLVELGQPEKVIVGGCTFSTRALTMVKHPEPTPLKFQSLRGIVDYLQSSLDAHVAPIDGDSPSTALFVADDQTITLISCLEEHTYQRATFAVAVADPCRFKFDSWHSQEQLVVALQALFVQTPERDALLRVVSSITDEAVGTSDDDGVTQQVSVRAGVMLKNRSDLPNPVTLRPYRTFREVEQPASAFVLRVRKDHEGIRLALFEADGGTWKIEARENVAAWLREKLGSAPVVLA